MWKASLKGFSWFTFTDYQVEYIISLSYCFFSRIKILLSTSVKQNLQNLRPLKITAYTVITTTLCTYKSMLISLVLYMIMTDREFDQNYLNIHNPLITNNMSNFQISQLSWFHRKTHGFGPFLTASRSSTNFSL